MVAINDHAIAAAAPRAPHAEWPRLRAGPLVVLAILLRGVTGAFARRRTSADFSRKEAADRALAFVQEGHSGEVVGIVLLSVESGPARARIGPLPRRLGRRGPITARSAHSPISARKLSAP